MTIKLQLKFPGFKQDPRFLGFGEDLFWLIEDLIRYWSSSMTFALCQAHLSLNFNLNWGIKHYIPSNAPPKSTYTSTSPATKRKMNSIVCKSMKGNYFSPALTKSSLIGWYTGFWQWFWHPTYPTRCLELGWAVSHSDFLAWPRSKIFF